MDGPAVEIASSAGPPQELKLGQLLNISALWLGLQFFWASQQLVVIPHRIEALVAVSDVGRMYGLMKAIGAVVVIITQLSVGFLSDRAHSKLGRRRPFIIWGLTSGCLAVTFFMLAPNYTLLLVGYLLLEATLNSAMVPFQSLLPDLVPEKQHAKAGSIMGLLDLGGNLLGFIALMAMTLFFKENEAAGFTHFLLPLYAVMLAITGTITVLGSNEFAWAQHPRPLLEGAVRRLRLMPGVIVEYAATARTLVGCIVRDYLAIDLSSQHNLFWLALSRFAIFFSYNTFLAYVGFYVKYNLDRSGFLRGLGVPEDKLPGLLGLVFPAVMVCFILGGLLGALLAAPIARRWSKKVAIGAGLIATSAMCLPLILTHNVPIAIGAGMVLGCGWGLFIASDWAFACTLMPKEQTASYMGLWGLASLFPQVVSPVVAGFLRDAIFNRFVASIGELKAWALANQWVFSSMFLYFLIGLVLLRNVQESRQVSSSEAATP